MSNDSKQYLLLIVVLTIATVVGLITLGEKLQQAHIKSIQQTVQQQLIGGK